MPTSRNSYESIEPLLPSPTHDEEAAVQGTNHCGRACKITGLTLLFGVLILGQVATAYFLVNQRNDITALQAHNRKLERELTILRAVSMPIDMVIPMDVLDLFADAMPTTGVPTEAPNTGNVQQTKCQQEAEEAADFDGFRPACDELGLYQVEQCHAGTCWCVQPVNGEVIPGSLKNGTANCTLTDETLVIN